MNVYVDGKRIRFKPANSIGKGGEADVYAVSGGRALKLFKQADHPDLAGMAADIYAAEERLRIHQQKLPSFPANLPPRVAVPLQLATDRAGSIVGYTMQMVDRAEVIVRLSDPGFRQPGDEDTVTAVFRDLHATVTGLHRRGVVIGDFNDLNILVRDGEAWMVDADSFQFAQFPCQVFTIKFVDPMHCTEAGGMLQLTAPHDEASDWYAYAAMLMQSLLCIHPYGGVYRPSRKSARVPALLRPLKRITILDPAVRLPKACHKPEILPDELLQYFHNTFVRDIRNAFPLALLNSLTWSSCPTCGKTHARTHCPDCVRAAPAAVKAVVTVRGTVTVTRMLRTTGSIVCAASEGGTLRYLIHKNDSFCREDGTVALSGENQRIRFALQGNQTLVAKDRMLMVTPTEKSHPVDTCEGVPQFAANGRHYYWLAQGTLYRDSLIAPEMLGSVLANQTRIWVGEAFGFGFYRAGGIHVAFVFDAEGRGINDSVKLPVIPGQLTGAQAFFSDLCCWLFVSSRHQGVNMCRCVVIRRDGQIEATASEVEPQSGWLATLTGKYAIGRNLFVATDDGIVRLEIDAGNIIQTREFPDTEPFVHAGCQLLASSDGLIVINNHDICLLQMDAA